MMEQLMTNWFSARILLAGFILLFAALILFLVVGNLRQDTTEADLPDPEYIGQPDEAAIASAYEAREATDSSSDDGPGGFTTDLTGDAPTPASEVATGDDDTPPAPPREASTSGSQTQASQDTTTTDSANTATGGVIAENGFLKYYHR